MAIMLITHIKSASRLQMQSFGLKKKIIKNIYSFEEKNTNKNYINYSFILYFLNYKLRKVKNGKKIKRIHLSIYIYFIYDSTGCTFTHGRLFLLSCKKLLDQCTLV